MAPFFGQTKCFGYLCHVENGGSIKLPLRTMKRTTDASSLRTPPFYTLVALTPVQFGCQQVYISLDWNAGGGTHGAVSRRVSRARRWRTGKSPSV
jgi:hypothetical protein